MLDLGCGIGGPARYLATTFGCKVTGVDLSSGFIDAATYLTSRCGLSDRVTFQVGDALHLPFDDASFDTVFLQHVAMNIDDRAALYREIRRILAPGAHTNIQFMFKNAKEYAATCGWGLAQFKNGKPDGGASLNTCFTCHNQVKARDLIFARYAP